MGYEGSSLPDLEDWHTSTQYARDGLDFTAAKFLEVSNLLLENPNLNSSHLFRADVLFDSAGVLNTFTQKEQLCYGSQPQKDSVRGSHNGADHDSAFRCTFNGTAPNRVVVRKLIPRNSNFDRVLEQTCLLYQYHIQGHATTYAVVYLPHAKDEAEIPWYHPPVKALAYFYEIAPQCSQRSDERARVSLHFLSFKETSGQIPDRLHRTFISLINTFIRLSKHESPRAAIPCGSDKPTILSTAPSALKDTIIPQHLVQNTYSRLKQTYASNLIARWVESTEPSKHVFEDLSIAAFLIELWKLMYHSRPFPGFVDIACGNGVLVYILLREGYHGWGFDARLRKTWDILGIDEHLEERICIPQPFLTSLQSTVEDVLPGVRVHDGIFPRDTFIVSNHADELTPWTPLLAALSCQDDPLPFLAIPCCSHALSGSKHRYTSKDVDSTSSARGTEHLPPNGVQTFINNADPQPSNGDLKPLRIQKAKAANHTDGKSMYACLTKKVIALAEEVGFEMEMTLMRIPSTRNIGVVGGRSREQSRDRVAGNELNKSNGDLERMEELSLEAHANEDSERNRAVNKVQAMLERECARSGGVKVSARTWTERAKKLQTGKGRGKVNLGHKPGYQNGNKTPRGEEAA